MRLTVLHLATTVVIQIFPSILLKLFHVNYQIRETFIINVFL